MRSQLALLAVLAGRTAGLAPSVASCVDVLTRAAATTASRPGAQEVTVALAELSNAGEHPESWADALARGEPWRPVFSAKPGALMAVRREDGTWRGRDVLSVSNAPLGRYLTVPGGQSFRWTVPGAPRRLNTVPGGPCLDDGDFDNTVRLFRGALKLRFSGSFSMSGRRMTLALETLSVRLLWFARLPKIDIREGRGVRGLFQRLRAERTADGFKKRPNVYNWCFADENICIAQGSSGVALWGR